MKRILILIICLCPLLLYGQNILSTLADMHSVVRGDTWESIAASRGISVAQLQAANPDVKGSKLKKGTLLIMPKPSTSLPTGEESRQDASEEPTHPLEKTVESSLIRTSLSDLKVGVLLPFGEKKMVEFYRGLLMAADSVRQSGVNLDIYAWDCGTTAAKIDSLLPRLKGMDVLFGPTSATQIPTVAELCREQGIRLVLPFWSGQPLLDYPLVYNAIASNAAFYDAAAKKLVSFYADNNFVIVHSGKTDIKGKALSEALTQRLAQQSGAPKVLSLEGDDFAYESAFNQFRDNMIVIDDSSIPSLNILVARLKDFRQDHPQYRISLLGYTEWQDETQRLLGDFFTLDTYIISPYYYNVLDERVKHFERSYAKNFRRYIAPGSPRYAVLGFDLGYYFLSGISSFGDTFEQMQGTLRQEPFQSWFRFERSASQASLTSAQASGLSFTNNFVEFIHFTLESKIELIR